jgi:hypothetical protein
MPAAEKAEAKMKSPESFTIRAFAKKYNKKIHL